MTRELLTLACLLVVSVSLVTSETFLGTIPNQAHDVGGKLYALDDRSVLIRKLQYDGLGPDAYFWVGTTKEPRSNGIKVPDETGSLKPLKRYSNAEVVLRLPSNLTLSDIKYFGLWCKKFRVDFGHVKLNRTK